MNVLVFVLAALPVALVCAENDTAVLAADAAVGGVQGAPGQQNDNCIYDNQYCDPNDNYRRCCSGNCDFNQRRCINNNGQCIQSGQYCDPQNQNSRCCQGSCDFNQRRCTNNGGNQCIQSGQTCDPQNQYRRCCQGNCDIIQRRCNGGGNNNCGQIGQRCNRNSECCSFKCQNYQCRQGFNDPQSEAMGADAGAPGLAADAEAAVDAAPAADAAEE